MNEEDRKYVAGKAAPVGADPADRFIVRSNWFTTIIVDPVSAYVLTLAPGSVADMSTRHLAVCFSYPFRDSDRKVNVTSRDVWIYEQLIPDDIEHPQVIEVGCGLGQLLQYICMDPKNPTPIAIDPADFNVMEQMLVYALTLQEDSFFMTHVGEVLERCRLVQDSQKVRFLNMTLGEAVEQHPEILGCADVVVDLQGATGHRDIEKDDVHVLESLLLKARPDFH